MLHLGQNREQIKDLIRHEMFSRGKAGEPGFEILAHRQKRKNLAPLRDIGDTFPGHLMRRQRAEVFAVQCQRPARAGMGARDRLDQAGLADTIGAHHTGHLTPLGLH